MTTFESRPPLQRLSMASSQRPSRRRSARNAFDDDDEPPAKRSKVDDGGAIGVNENQVNGHVKNATGRRKKPSYDEEDNGFMFKRTRSKQPEVLPAPEPAPHAAVVEPPERAPSKRKRKSFSSPVIDVKTVQQPRRSKRLSGDKVPEPSTPAQLKIKRRETIAPKPPPQRSSESPQLVGGDVEVERPRNGTKIALPFADTPVQNRNKQMREKASNRQKNRRSSSGIRGRRASSLLDSGTSNGGSSELQPQPLGISAQENISGRQHPTTTGRQLSVVSEEAISNTTALHGGTPILEEEIEANVLEPSALPHADVDTRDFYKHIDQTLPEPHRMRHLLTWCAARALPEKLPGATRDATETLAIDAARHIQEELLKDFNSKPEMSEWFNREDTVPRALVKKPNPRNIQNAAKVQELEREIAQLQGEKTTWDTMLASTSKSTSAQIASGEEKLAIDAAALDDPIQAATLEALKASQALPSNVSQRLQAIKGNLEPQIDAFADGIHRIAQYRLSAERVADRVLSTAAERLEKRDRAAQQAAGTMAVGPREVLSALANVLNRRDAVAHGR